MKYIVTCLILAAIILTACAVYNSPDTPDASKMEKWKLGWRVIGSSWDKNHQLGEQQFDSLLAMNGSIETKFLVAGLEILFELGKNDKISEVLRAQDEQTLALICSNGLFANTQNSMAVCKPSIKAEKVGNKDLQLELIKMHLNDQSARGLVRTDLIRKYNLEDFDITQVDLGSVDYLNRERLKEIIVEFGFPTKELVGKDAMQTVFLIIQHSDQDTEWQKEQLSRIEQAVKRGDMDGQSYAYLYDRIKVNGGEKQLYGTQFKNVDPATGLVELADTEDIGNVDQRRMEAGMMPLEMYKQFILRGAPK